MMLIITALVIVVVPLVDPIVALFYATAAIVAKSVKAATAYGLVAGVLLALLTLAIFGMPSKPVYLIGRVGTCVLGAVLVRLAINGGRKLFAT